MKPGEELVIEPFQRLMEERQLVAVPYDGFWRNMDTFKDKMELDEIHRVGKPPWERWRDGEAVLDRASRPGGAETELGVHHAAWSCRCGSSAAGSSASRSSPPRSSPAPVNASYSSSTPRAPSTAARTRGAARRSCEKSTR